MSRMRKIGFRAGSIAIECFANPIGEGLNFEVVRVFRFDYEVAESVAVIDGVVFEVWIAVEKLSKLLDNKASLRQVQFGAREFEGYKKSDPLLGPRVRRSNYNQSGFQGSIIEPRIEAILDLLNLVRFEPPQYPQLRAHTIRQVPPPSAVI